MKQDRYINTSLAKALEILDLFDDKRVKLSLSEIAKFLGVRPGSVYPILYTLMKYGYINRDPDSKQFHLGLKLLTHANKILSSLDLREKAKPFLRRLAKDLAANAHLAVLYEDEVLYLDREEAAPSIVLPSVVGRRVPAYCTALGKVLLAYQPKVAELVLAKKTYPALTPHTITKAEELEEELAQIRKQGYAIDNEEFYEGNICVAAPIRNYRGTIVAAISISLSKGRVSKESISKFVQKMTAAAEDISKEMGYHP